MTYGRTKDGWTDRRDSRNSVVDGVTHLIFIVSFRFDARDKSLLTYASHFSPIYGQRASMRLPNGLTSSKKVAVLVLSHLRPEDEGVYKCRADFKKSPTKNNRTYLSVLCEYIFKKTYIFIVRKYVDIISGYLMTLN